VGSTSAIASIIKEYLFGTNTITDWKVGSTVSFQGEFDGHSYHDKGVVFKTNPERNRLVTL
jgi:hypothetical protein